MNDSLTFDKEWFEDEVRDGFYVPSMMKRAWASQMTALFEIDRICQRHDIVYALDWGTELGAIRHKGFIPWDDDIDICMHRNELNKFLLHADELPEGYVVNTFENLENYWGFIVKVADSCRHRFETAYLDEHFGFPYVTEIDIFVYDNLADDDEEEQRRDDILMVVLGIADSIDSPDLEKNGAEKLIRDAERIVGHEIKRSADLYEQRVILYREALNILSLYSGKDVQSCSLMFNNWLGGGKIRYPQAHLLNTVRRSFEQMMLPVPADYIENIKIKFGQQYDVFRIGGSGHGYPYYESIRKSFGEDMDFAPQYRFSPDDLKKSFCDEKANGEKKVIIFLPFRAKEWGYLEPFYKKCAEDPGNKVYIIPLTFQYKKWDGSLIGEAYNEGDELPEGLDVTFPWEIDISGIVADEIYIQNPYDEFNMALTVDPVFYARNLRGRTKKLIYVQPFELTDFDADDRVSAFNMRYYCPMPGVVMADEVYVGSWVLRQRYIEELTRVSCEDYRPVWEEKIKVKA